MSVQITPALSADEWRDRSARLSRHADVQGDVAGEPSTLSLTLRTGTPGARRAVEVLVDVDRLPAVIALANAARDEDDPAKLTWAMVDAIRVAGTPESMWYREDPVLLAAADAIAALLPPREAGR